MTSAHSLIRSNYVGYKDFLRDFSEREVGVSTTNAASLQKQLTISPHPLSLSKVRCQLLFPWQRENLQQAEIQQVGLPREAFLAEFTLLT